MSRFLEPTRRLLAHRDAWHYRGNERPPFATEPKPGQESVWDYPRPPRIVADPRLVEVRAADGTLVISTNRALRVLETASPPTFYVPPEAVPDGLLETGGERSLCEWKGEAVGLRLRNEKPSVGWCYPAVFPEFEAIEGWYSFYPARIPCFVAGERVRPQPGGYYGGWITEEIVGPVKGEPGCDGL